MSDYPNDAERHTRSDFVTMKKPEKSRLLPGKFLPAAEEFFCPACGLLQPGVPVHGHGDGCTRCELRWISYGNSLYLWKVKKADAA